MRALWVVGLWGGLAGAASGQHPELRQAPASVQPPASAASPAAEAQTKGGVTTLAVEARLVNLTVVVRDKNGALVQNLAKGDFVLQVDGTTQTVRYFNQDANLPLTLGLLVDTSQSQRGVIEEERSASRAFLEQMLTGPQDRAFVLQFARQVELLQDVTESKPKLQAALQELATPNSRDASGGNDGVDPEEARERRNGGGTVLYDSVFLASDELMAKQKGRKALVLLTDGNDRNSKESLTRAIEMAQRGDTIVYAIYFKGEEPKRDRDDYNDSNRGGRGGGYPGGGYPGGGYPGGGYPGGGYPGGGYPGGGYPGGGGGGRGSQRLPDRKNEGKKILERMTAETGGRMFEATKKQPVAEIYAEIGRELRAQYRLGYTPEAATAAAGYHRVSVELTGDRKKLTVQTQEGYYAGR